MKPKSTLFVLLILMLINARGISQEITSKVKIHAPKDKYLFSELVGALELDHYMPADDGAIITEISSSDILKLKARRISYEILVKDVAKELDSINREYYQAIQDPQKRVAFEQPGGRLDQLIKRPAAFEVKSTFGGYYSFVEMEAAMDALVAAYPAIASKTSLGKTVNNRDIWMIKISDNVASNEANEPEMLFMGLQHAREAITGASMIFFMQYLCENYSTDSRIKDLVDNRVFYIVPCFNPDGWEHNRTIQNGGPGGMWRKNRRLISGTTYGVDLNRNWGVDWAHCSAPILGNAGSCGSSTISSDTYWGSAAFSEAETQAIRTFAKTRKLVIGFDQHAYGPYYSLPFGRKSLHPNDMPVKGAQYFTAIPAMMGKYNGMRAADSYDALGYEVAGGFKDWMLMGELGVGTKDTVWAMTGEGGGGSTTSTFWPAASQIVNLCKGMTYQNLQLAYSAGTYVDIEDMGSIAVNASAGNFPFRIKRVGLGNDPVTISLIPLENMLSAGPSVTVNSMTYYQDHLGSISYSLPALNNGARIKYIWRVETTGYSYSDTIEKLFNPTQLLFDNMEGNLTTNWIVPSGNADTKWGFTSLSAFSGTKSMTESTAGNYPAGTSRIVTYNSTLDLTNATATYLSFWVKHRAENFRDKLQVQVSIDGTTWVPVAGRTTVQEPGTLDGSTLNGQPALTGIRDYWIKEVFNLSAYNSSPALRLRLVFTSDNTSSSFLYKEDDGFYIDDLMVVKSTGSLVVLPSSFLDLSGKLLETGKVALKWNAIVDERHDHFLLERSGTGVDFHTIAKINEQPPNEYIDHAPLPNMNYYRVRQTDRDGKTQYSKTINVLVKNKFRVSLFPNPVIDNLLVKIFSSEPVRSVLRITDMQGREVMRKVVNLESGTGEVMIDLSSLRPMVYLLTVTDEKNEVQVMQKIIKN
jgi:carboxypeptidase T